MPSVLPESFFPLSASKLEFFKWIYRVKTWQVDIDLTITQTFGDVYTLFGTGFIPSGYSLTGSAYADESELSCSVGVNGISAPIVAGGTWTPAIGAPSNFDIAAWIDFSTIFPALEYDPGYTDDYRYLRLSDGAEATDEETEDNEYMPGMQIGVMTDYPNFIVKSGPNPTPEATINATWDGNNVPIYSVLNPGDIVTGTLVITPSAWWEHDPGDGGGPVWNASTGAEERSPASLP